MRRVECSACGYDDLELFLDLGYSPIADAYTSTAEESSKTYPLQLAVCTGCWLVQLLEVIDHDVLFGTGYSFYSSASTPLSMYHAEYATDVLSKYGILARRLTVEIGCNDGDMLRHFQTAGCKSIGIDPASGPAAVAIEQGLTVLVEPFGRLVAERIRDESGPAGVVIANHVLAHVESVADVLDGVQHLLADDGVAFIEVQYLPDLLVNNAFDLVYHEHRNFFSLTSLERAVERWGLHVIDTQLTDRQGGSLRVTLSRHRERTTSRDKIRASETWLRGYSTYTGFQGRVNRVRDRLQDLVVGNSLVLGYGAPAKATTLLNFCEFDVNSIWKVVDTTPAKQGRFIPGTRGVEIVPPETVLLNSVDRVLLLAWNYAPQIMRKHVGYTSHGGHWIVPIPAPILL